MITRDLFAGLRADKGLTFTFNAPSLEVSRQIAERYAGHARWPGLDTLVWVTREERKTSQVTLTPLDPAGIPNPERALSGELSNPVLTHSVSLRVTLWPGAQPGEFKFVYGDEIQALQLAAAAPLTQEQRQLWDDFAAELQARNERMKLIPAVRTCAGCGREFAAHDVRQLYHDAFCGNRSRVRKHRAKEVLSAVI